MCPARCEEGSKLIMVDNSPAADVSSSSFMRGEKTTEDHVGLAALLSLCTSPSAPRPQRNRHLCALSLGSMKTYICCQEGYLLGHWCVGCGFLQLLADCLSCHYISIYTHS